QSHQVWVRLGEDSGEVVGRVAIQECGEDRAVAEPDQRCGRKRRGRRLAAEQEGARKQAQKAPREPLRARLESHRVYLCLNTRAGRIRSLCISPDFSTFARNTVPVRARGLPKACALQFR